MSPVSAARFLVEVALRNLVRHWVKSAIVGAIMAFGTFLIVAGTAHLDSIQEAMEKSVTGSVAGHLQVYDAGAKDELALFGGMAMSRPDIGFVPDFEKVKRVLSAVPNVETVVPMGLDTAISASGSDLDRNLAELRAAVAARDERRIRATRGLIRQHLAVLTEEMRNVAELSSDTEKNAQSQAELLNASSDEFWAKFEAEPLDALEYLENKIAPIGAGGKSLFLRYVGTDLDLFQQKFDRFQIVEGTMVPSGKRGFLLNKKFMEDWIKHLVARELDKVKKLRVEGKLIADDVAVQEAIRRNARQYRRILFQLDADETAKLEAALHELLPASKGDLAALTQELLTVDDSNFDRHYEFFYRVVAPMIELYDVRVGDILTLTGWTRSGYQKSINVKVYGTFQFKGVESSALAGSFSLTDLGTFRDLLGLMTADKQKELAAIKERVGVTDVKREDAEEALFGGSGDVTAVARTETAFDESSLGGTAPENSWDLPITREDLDQGVILNAAVLLKDPRKLRGTQAALEKAAGDAGLKLKVVGWREASGLVGQFIMVIGLVLFVAIFIIIVVALVIINNTMVMATMERVNEIGTMRAIGAQRRFVLMMFLFESLVLGFLSGLAGSGLAAALVGFLGQKGLHAGTDFLVFLFGGPRLFPHLGTGHVILGMTVTLLVGLVSAIYPAWIATRVQPIEAMRAED